MAGYWEEFSGSQNGLQSAAATMIKALPFSLEVGFQQIMVEFFEPTLTSSDSVQ